MNAEYYARLLDRLREEIKEKRRGKLRKGVLILHDNAPVHTAFKARSSLNKNGFTEINHPAYSPDLAPCDYFLFKNLKKNLRGRRFSTDEEMKDAVNDHFDAQNQTYFFNGMMSLIDKCHKCISVAGDYIEK